MMSATPANAPGPGEPEEEASEGGEEASEKMTAYLPMEFFSKTPEIGKTCTVKVVDVGEDGEVEVEYVAHDADKPARPAAPFDGEDEGPDETYG